MSDVGWSLPFDTATLPNGKHILTISGGLTAGNYATASAAFVVANWTSATSNPIRVNIDSPNAHSPVFSGTASFGGWIESNHDTTAKQLLATALPAGQTAEQDLAQALHMIFMQPSLPPFVSKQLIQHLVTSNPSPAYISRVAQVFEDNGAGVRGDLKAVVYAILSDPEARAGDTPGETDPSGFGHLREPVLFLANPLRGLNGAVSNSSGAANTATNLGQQLFYASSVFSFFSPLYNLNGLPAPEFQIYTTQTAAFRANVVNSVVYGGKLDSETTFNTRPFLEAASTPAALIGLINGLFFHGTMSNNLQSAITQALAPLKASADKVKAALYIALTSSEYQIVH